MGLTPWSEFVELGEHPYQIGFDKAGNYTAIMWDAAGNFRSCHANPTTKVVHVSVDSGNTYTQTDLFHFRLESWAPHLGRPVIWMHPFGVVHLAISDLVPELCIRALANGGALSLGTSAHLETNCRLLQRMGRLDVIIAVSAAYDLEYPPGLF